jgi:hypothetical protein
MKSAEAPWNGEGKELLGVLQFRHAKTVALNQIRREDEKHWHLLHYGLNAQTPFPHVQ